jgi:hypothetical protein
VNRFSTSGCVQRLFRLYKSTNSNSGFSFYFCKSFLIISMDAEFIWDANGEMCSFNTKNNGSLSITTFLNYCGRKGESDCGRGRNGQRASTQPIR